MASHLPDCPSIDHPLRVDEVRTQHGDLTVEEWDIVGATHPQVSGCIYNIVTLHADEATVVDTSLTVVYE